MTITLVFIRYIKDYSEKLDMDETTTCVSLLCFTGKDVLETFTEECSEDCMYLYTMFEYTKRNAGTEKKMETIRVPLSLVQRFRKGRKEAGQEQEITFKNSKLRDSVKLDKDKLRVNHDLVKNLFKESLDNITLHVEELLTMCNNISTIILAGGYSESQLLQNAFRSKFPDQQIIVPEEAGLAVVKGAVMYGHDPHKIISRVAPFTYGIGKCVKFDEDIHPEHKKVICDGVPKCDDIFDVHITKGQDLK